MTEYSWNCLWTECCYITYCHSTLTVDEWILILLQFLTSPAQYLRLATLVDCFLFCL